ncbi:MAG: putative Ig domain-containing protein, partial [Burkholderiales bacterium]
LPAWLVFDPDSASFSAAPGFADGGAYALRVTATDSGGASATGEFTLDIFDAEPPANSAGQGHHGEHGDDQHHDDHHHRRDHGREHDSKRDTHDRHERDLLCERLAQKPQYDFSLLARELERRKPQETLSPEEIRRSWERVARAVEKLGSGEDDFAHGAGDAGEPLRVAAGGGHGFGYDGSIGAGRAREGFTPFEGLREGFRRL